MPVYDDPTKTDNLGTGIGPDEERAMEVRAESGAQADLRMREQKSVAAGKNPSVQSSDHDGNNTGGGGGGKDKDTRGDLDDQEGGSFFKGDKDGAKKSMPRRVKRNIAIASFISGLVGIGSGAGIAGYVSGPLQFLHAANLLSQVHLGDKDDETEVRLMKTVRYIHAFARGTPERSRLGVGGNYIADRAEARFNKIGVTSNYGTLGVGRGYTINPKLLRGGSFDKIDPNKRTPQGVKDFLKSEFGINATVDGDRVLIDTTKSDFNYRTNIRFTNALQRASGAWRITSAIASRFSGKRSGIGWHKITNLDRKAHISIEDRYNAFLERENASLKEGSGSVKAGVDTEKDPKTGESVGSADADSGAIQETLDGAAQAKNSPESMKEFRAKMQAKLGKPLGLAAVVDILCILLFMSQHIDQLNRDNIENPLMRFAVAVMSVASQIQTGIGLSGNTDQLGFFSKMWWNPEDSSSFFDSKAIKSSQGLAGGQDINQKYKVGKDDNILGNLFNGANDITGYLQATCKVTTSLIGTILLTGLTIAAGGGIITTAVSAVVGAIALPMLIDYISDKMAGDEVKMEKLVGADGGGAAWYGGFFFGNNLSMASGGLPISPAENLALKQTTEDIVQEEFQSKSLAYRLFSPDDPHSFMAQIIQRQRPDPTANIAMYASGILNMGKTFGSLFSKPLLSMTVGAQEILPYNYGQPAVAYTLGEMQDARYEIPPDNEKRATTILDNDVTEPTYVKRAIVCFGITLQLEPKSSTDPTQVWAVRAPQNGDQPLVKKVEAGKSSTDPYDNTDYKCMDKQEDNWQVIRFFIMDSQAMNAYVCYDGKPTDEYTKKACQDIGQDTDEPKDAAIMDIDNAIYTDVATEDSTTSLQRKLASLKLPSIPVSSILQQPTIGTYNELFNHIVSRAGGGYVF